jgi:hypothetical protein
MSAPRFSRLNVVWELPESWCESDHLAGALAEVERRLAAQDIARFGLAQHFVFVVTSLPDRIAMKHRERVVVLQTSDEGHEIPSYADEVFMVFKNYPSFAKPPDNVKFIPLGCNKDVPALPARPMNARGTDVFFIGRKEFRDDFFAAALPLNEREDLVAQIGVGPAFREGMAPTDYAAMLADTKIALCPRGVSHETFRTYEALRAGCAVIAARHLSSWWTAGWPVIEIDDWAGLGTLIDELRADPVRLDALGQRGLAWWRARCSPKAVGAHIVGDMLTRLAQ